MKKVIIAVLLCALLFSFSACTSKEAALYDYDLSEYVSLGQYRELSLRRSDFEVTDADVDEKIEALLAEHATEEGVVPVLDEDFLAAYYPQYPSKDALREGVRTDLEAQAELARINTYWAKIMENCEIKKYPDLEYNLYYEDTLNYYRKYAESVCSMPLGEMLSSEGLSESEFEANIESEVKELIGQEMVLHAIAREMNISVSDEEYRSEGEAVAKREGYDSLDALEKAYGEAKIRRTVLMDKVLLALLDTCVYTDE